MIDQAPPFVPSMVVAGRGEVLPPTEAVERAVILMTGRRWRKLARRYPLKRHPHFRWALDGYCPGDWLGIIRAAIAEGGLDNRLCRPLEPVFEGQWGYCRTCGYYYRAHKDVVYRVSGADLAREVTE